MDKCKNLNDYGNFRKERAYNSAEYNTAKKYASLFSEQAFTIKQIKNCVEDITYRKINDWENKGLLVANREKNPVGWRRFSINDVLILFIISDLKKFGLNYHKIKTIIDKISQDTIKPKNNKNVEEKFLKLEYNFLCGMQGEKLYLMIDKYNSHLFDTILVITDFIYNDSYLDPKIIILPFFFYIQTLSNKLLNISRKYPSDSIYLKFFELRLTDQEKKIMKIIRDKKYQEIFIKKDNDEFKIKTKIRKNGLISDKDIINLINSKEYQNVTVITENGKKISIIQEIREKI